MISIYKPNSNSASFGRFLEWDELRVCYDTEIKFSAGLAWVKAETLSGSGRVRSGYGSGNLVKAFFIRCLFQPYPLTQIGLARQG
jgi:hypothetical protein